MKTISVEALTHEAFALSPTPSVVALGCFDGVHLGHRAVIREARQIADREGLPLTVWSFREPPKHYFSKQPIPLLTTPEEKNAQIAALGADTILSIAFDASIAAMSAEDFFALLAERVGALHVVCGFDFTFGAGGRGKVSLLASLCERAQIGLSVLPPYEVDGQAVSSSFIRACIEKGDVVRAARDLGRPYSLSAEVVSGQHLARNLGFPTANQLFAPKKAVPRYGVYAVRAKIGEQLRYGISNVGMRPTVRGTLLCCETHFFDFSGDLYGEMLTVEFLDFVRPEQKFTSLDALTAQIARDVAAVKASLPSALS